MPPNPLDRLKRARRWSGFGQRFLAALRLRSSAYPRHSRNQARTVVLCCIGAVLILHFGLVLLARNSPHLRDPLYGGRAAALHKRISETAAKHGPPTVMIMLGTSRSAHGFNGQHFEDLAARELHKPVVAYNYGLIGSGPITHLLYLRRLLKEGIKPDLLLLEILPVLFSDYQGYPYETGTLLAGRVHRDEIAYLQKYGIPAEPFEEGWTRLWFNPWGEMRFQILSRIKTSMLPNNVIWGANKNIDAWGWTPIKFDQAPPDEYAKNFERARLEHGPALEHFVVSQPAVAALKDLLTICRNEQIPVMLVLTPEGSDFRKLYSPRTIEQVKVLFTDISKESGISIIDARDWIADDQFSDSHHLLQRGATQFTERLAVEYAVPAAKRIQVSR